MKKYIQRKHILTTGAILLTVFGTLIVQGSQAGSSADPLVSKSYVDGKILEISNILDKQSSGNIDMDALVSEVKSKLEIEAGGSFQVVELAENQKLIGGEGTEIILRAGNATIYSEGVDGLSDLTQGNNMTHGEKIGENHLLIVPRADRRGIRAQSKSYCMVKGTFTIE